MTSCLHLSVGTVESLGSSVLNSAQLIKTASAEALQLFSQLNQVVINAVSWCVVCSVVKKRVFYFLFLYFNKNRFFFMKKRFFICFFVFVINAVSWCVVWVCLFNQVVINAVSWCVVWGCLLNQVVINAVSWCVVWGCLFNQLVINAVSWLLCGDVCSIQFTKDRFILKTKFRKLISYIFE